MTNGRTTSSNGDWIRTMIGAISAVGVTVSGMYTVVIVPMQHNLEKLEATREADRKDLVGLYLSIRENDQYKIFAQSERAALRSDINKNEAHLLRIEGEQKSRAISVATVPALEKRIDGLVRRHEELEQRSSSSYTLNDELKSLRSELQDLRRRIMIPIGTNSKDH